MNVLATTTPAGPCFAGHRWSQPRVSGTHSFAALGVLGRADDSENARPSQDLYEPS